MPRFMGSRLNRKQHQTSFKEVYEFTIEPPEDAGYGPGSALKGKVPLDLSELDEAGADPLRTFMSEGLAREFGARLQGDLIDIVLLEEDANGCSRFLLPVEVYFASANRGEEYIQIGTVDLDNYFDLFRCNNGSFLDLRLKEGVDRLCLEEPNAGQELVDV